MSRSPLRRRRRVRTPGSTISITLAFLPASVSLSRPRAARRAGGQHPRGHGTTALRRRGRSAGGCHGRAWSRGGRGKRLDAPYAEGRRCRSWIKIKHRRRERLAVTGWRERDGAPARACQRRRRAATGRLGLDPDTPPVRPARRERARTGCGWPWRRACPLPPGGSTAASSKSVGPRAASRRTAPELPSPGCFAAARG